PEARQDNAAWRGAAHRRNSERSLASGYTSRGFSTGGLMCDQDHYDDDLKAYKERAAVSRREFGALAAGAGMAFVLQRPANAVAVTESDVKHKTADATDDLYLAR